MTKYHLHMLYTIYTRI